VRGERERRVWRRRVSMRVRRRVGRRVRVGE
jgi:hypothetical protein